jgi:diketogulonate reductase-like aldo/keto reductase
MYVVQPLTLLPLAILLWLQGAEVVSANFFSRILKLGGDKDDKPAPSGVKASVGSEAQVGSPVGFEGGILMAHLSNNNRIPLVGVGVGNAQHEHVSAIVAEAIQNDKRIRLIDTAHASLNEGMVAEGILAGIGRLGLDEKLEVHVVTKVWYTHLGYERTKISVDESLKALEPALASDKVSVKLHILLHWPKCYDNVEWMDCSNEEASLSDVVKNAGPDPTKDPDNAWKESWKYLEDLYLSDKYPVESIGISNFHIHDMEVMENFARIRPHVLQVNLWSLLYDTSLVDYCHKHRIHVQVYNAIQGTIVQPERAPRAFHYIQKVANEITQELELSVTPGQVILAWLIQHGVSVIPRTSRLNRLEENSAVSVSTIPALTETQVESIAHAVEAYMSGSDMEHDIHVSVTFHAVNQDIMLYWVGTDGEEVRITHVRKGETFNDTTYPNHVFRTYNAYDKDVFTDHQINVNFGEHKHIHVEL